MGSAFQATATPVPPSGPAVKQSATVELDIAKIRRDEKTQGRASLEPEVIQEYASLIRSGVKFPPVKVWCDGSVSAGAKIPI